MAQPDESRHLRVTPMLPTIHTKTSRLRENITVEIFEDLCLLPIGLFRQGMFRRAVDGGEIWLFRSGFLLCGRMN